MGPRLLSTLLVIVMIVCLPLVMILAEDEPSGGDDPVGSTDAGGQDAASGMTTGVAGRVTDARMRPLAEVFVQPQSLDDPMNIIPELAVLTDEEGRYAWDLLPGRYSLTVNHEGYRPQTKEVTVSSGAISTLDFVLE